MKTLRLPFVAIVLALALAMVACAPKKAPEPGPPQCTLDMVRDLRDFPQNLEVYARLAGVDRKLLDASEQARFDATFNRILFGPWHMSRTSVSRREMVGMFGSPRGYKDGSRLWTRTDWDAMKANADASAFPSRAQSAITLRNTDLRELPTHEARFSKPTPRPADNPFDNFQYSLLPVGTPLLVAHTSRDGRWYFVECPVAGGWVDANDVAFVDEDFKKIWCEGKFAALIRDRVQLPGTGQNGTDGIGNIGAVLPLASKNPDGSLNILVPLKGANGFAKTAEITVGRDAAVQKPMPLTPGNVAKVGNVMMGQPYGWGGMLGERDCSALTRELLTPFGIWLPRNSVAQARRGAVISLEGMSAEQKKKIIMANGVPFLSLVGMRGHITLYVGAYNGQPAIFHNVWGVRVIQDGDDNGRCVIGHAVVTSIMPGIELQNLYRPVTFVDRLRALTNVGSYHKTKR